MSAKLCVKYTMFVFNFIFFLMGCAILGLGIWLKVEKDDYADISKYNFITAANIIIAAGVIIVIVSFFGCFGAIKEIPALLLIYFVLLLIIFILEISAAAFAYSKRDKIEEELSTEFRKAIKEDYYQDPNSGITKAIDKFQSSFDCCGFSNYSDWRDSYFNRKKGTIPLSCCINPNRATKTGLTCGSNDPKAIDLYYKRGCFEEVKKFLKDNLLYIGACSIAFAVIQILGMVFSMYLFCQYRGGKGILA